MALRCMFAVCANRRVFGRSIFIRFLVGPAAQLRTGARVFFFANKKILALARELVHMNSDPYYCAENLCAGGSAADSHTRET